MIDSADTFLSLIHSDDADARRKAVEEQAELATWLELLSRGSSERHAVVLNKRLPDEVLVLLARDEEAEIRWHVAMKRRLPDEARELLAADPDETVRMRVARNRRTPRPILIALSADSSALVKDAARSSLGE